MDNRFGDLVLPGLDGSRELLRREDIIESLVLRWHANGFDCPKAYDCLDEQDTPTLAKWLLDAVLGGTCPMQEAEPARALSILPENIQN
jgi:hypothetical protein